MRKRRTREHIIADLSVNHLERFILTAGHVPATLTKDYGYDMAFFTHDSAGEPEDGIIFRPPTRYNGGRTANPPRSFWTPATSNAGKAR